MHNQTIHSENDWCIRTDRGGSEGCCASLLLLLQLFGEGKHPDIDRLFETRLAPFLSQKAFNFWNTRTWYFKEGLYYQGGMVSAVLPYCHVLQYSGTQ
jgi:hypothetical protein